MNAFPGTGSRVEVVREVNGNVVEETVDARPIMVRDMQRYLENLNHPIELVALTTRRSAEWVETLHVESFNALVELADRINTAPLTDAFRRNLDRAESMVPGTRAKIEQAIASGQMNGVPVSPSNAGSPMTPCSTTVSTNSTRSGAPSNDAAPKPN